VPPLRGSRHRLCAKCATPFARLQNAGEAAWLAASAHVSAYRSISCRRFPSFHNIYRSGYLHRQRTAAAVLQTFARPSVQTIYQTVLHGTPNTKRIAYGAHRTVRPPKFRHALQKGRERRGSGNGSTVPCVTLKVRLCQCGVLPPSNTATQHSSERLTDAPARDRQRPLMKHRYSRGWASPHHTVTPRRNGAEAQEEGGERRGHRNLWYRKRKQRVIQRE